MYFAIDTNTFKHVQLFLFNEKQSIIIITDGGTNVQGSLMQCAQTEALQMYKMQMVM